MSDKQLTKKRKQLEKSVELPTTFSPRLWSDADGRIAIVKAIRKKAGEYKEDSNADTSMKETLCERAAFIRVRLDSYELEMIEGKAIAEGVYTQMVNCLSGLLTKLGLDKQAANGPTLEGYLKSKETKQ